MIWDEKNINVGRCERAAARVQGLDSCMAKKCIALLEGIVVLKS
jgi:hypothetical protein